MRLSSHLGALLVTTLATAGLSSPARAQGGPPPTPVRVDAAVQEEVQSMRRVSGEIRAKRRSLVAVREEGLVAELHVREGQRVKAGEVLAQLDPQRLVDELAVLLAELPQAAAGVQEQEALLEQVQNDLRVLEELAERDAVNPKELMDARSAVAVARARTERARTTVGLIEARIARLERRIADMAPTAPFDGVVVARTTEVGQWLAAGATIVELVADTELEVHVDVPQGYYGPLTSLEGAIELDVTAGGRRSSTNWRVVPQIASTGRTFPLIADLDDSTGLAPGMSVIAEVPTGERAMQLTVSRDGILRGPTGSFVYVAQPPAEEGAPHSASIAPVEVLFYLGDRAVVRSRAVRPGAMVVVEGNERLYPTAPVAPMEMEASAPEVESDSSTAGFESIPGKELSDSLGNRLEEIQRRAAETTMTTVTVTTTVNDRGDLETVSDLQSAALEGETRVHAEFIQRAAGDATRGNFVTARFTFDSSLSPELARSIVETAIEGLVYPEGVGVPVVSVEAPDPEGSNPTEDIEELVEELRKSAGGSDQ